MNGRISPEFQIQLMKSGWYDHISWFFNTEEWSKITKNITARTKAGAEIYPKKDDIFRALMDTPYDEVKCVIVGQDPYCQPGAANGLAFAANPGRAIQPSLRNILKEVENDVKCFIPKHKRSLTGWSTQGVLLLNSILTIEKDHPGSHKSVGWQAFTDAVMAAVAKREKPVAFLLWGKDAQEKRDNISMKDQMRNAWFTASHPSPQSSHGFFGCKHFSQVNEFLIKQKVKEIDWTCIDKCDLIKGVFLPTWTEEDDIYERRSIPEIYQS